MERGSELVVRELQEGSRLERPLNLLQALIEQQDAEKGIFVCMLNNFKYQMTHLKRRVVVKDRQFGGAWLVSKDF